MRTKRSQEGYLLIDHRNAPGIAGGVGAGQTFESATITCSHCQRIVVLNPDRTRPRNYCTGCDKYICDGCAHLRSLGATCKTFKQIVDEREAQLMKGIVNGEVVCSQE